MPFPKQNRCQLGDASRVVDRIFVLGHKLVLEGHDHEIRVFLGQPVTHLLRAPHKPVSPDGKACAWHREFRSVHGHTGDSDRPSHELVKS